MQANMAFKNHIELVLIILLFVLFFGDAIVVLLRRYEMSAWIYISGGIFAVIVSVVTFVLLTLADDWDSVNGEVNHSEGWDW